MKKRVTPAEFEPVLVERELNSLLALCKFSQTGDDVDLIEYAKASGSYSYTYFRVEVESARGWMQMPRKVWGSPDHLLDDCASFERLGRKCRIVEETMFTVAGRNLFEREVVIEF